MLRTDLRRDYLRTQVARLDSVPPEEVGHLFEQSATEAVADFENDGVGADRLTFHRHADMRYAGQEHTVKVPFPAGEVTREKLAESERRFHEAHEREYAFRLDSPVEIVNYHLVAYGAVRKPEMAKLERTARELTDAIKGRREVDFGVHGVHTAEIYDRSFLGLGAEFLGPAVVEEPMTTVVVPPGWLTAVDQYGNLHLNREKA
jgi:N-methylhydantoinase A